MCICAFVGVSIGVYICKHVYACAFMCEYVYNAMACDMHVFVHVRGCICVYMCDYVGVCICTHACVGV